MSILEVLYLNSYFLLIPHLSVSTSKILYVTLIPTTDVINKYAAIANNIQEVNTTASSTVIIPIMNLVYVSSFPMFFFMLISLSESNLILNQN